MSTPHITPNANVTLQASSVSKSFVSGRVQSTVLQNLTLDVRGSELTLISGPSGCGKSTLLAILSGLQPADGGSVRALGQELSGLSINDLEYFRLQHTGFVFQGFNLFPALTALEQVELPLSYMGLPKGMARKRAVESLEEVGLGSRMRLRPTELSGGEKQRVAIARALAKQPELLFADEPTSALDSDNGQIIIDILHRIARNHGTTVLCVSHDPRLVGHADRVLAMEDGRILSDHVPPAPSKAPEAKEPSA
ncbi:ABC transporter ATP-binding protein [Dyella dinghuensis]|uniref:ABC transporter ATP-binding protein n=1 Tax=Dyella dinghuensis TaxID=1920169 RepID=A0A3S0S2D4_9GAMM|nr:ABC transporter ATP-binding protein [Dyella dinghuensis]RUL62483.1 ABC transporter ATP-binding protein [Dyella dinghuensis]